MVPNQIRITRFKLETLVRITQWMLPSPLWWVHIGSTHFFCWNLANQRWIKVIYCSASGLLEHSNLKFWLTVNSRIFCYLPFPRILLIRNVLWYKDLYSAAFTKCENWSVLYLTMTYFVPFLPFNGTIRMSQSQTLYPLPIPSLSYSPLPILVHGI